MQPLASNTSAGFEGYEVVVESGCFVSVVLGVVTIFVDVRDGSEL